MKKLKKLTRKQIFDLHVKWIDITRFFIENNVKDWYNMPSTWKMFSYNQNLTEEFIREFSDRLDWTIFTKSQPLSEEFIWEFKDMIDWEYVNLEMFSNEFYVKAAKEGYLK